MENLNNDRPGEWWLPTSSSDTFESDVGAEVERPDYLWEGDVVIVVDDWRWGRDEDAQSDRLYHGGGLAVVHPAPVATLVWDGQPGHHQLRQGAGYGGFLINTLYLVVLLMSQSNDLDIRTQ